MSQLSHCDGNQWDHILESRELGYVAYIPCASDSDTGVEVIIRKIVHGNALTMMEINGSF